MPLGESMYTGSRRARKDVERLHQVSASDVGRDQLCRGLLHHPSTADMSSWQVAGAETAWLCLHGTEAAAKSHAATVTSICS